MAWVYCLTEPSAFQPAAQSWADIDEMQVSIVVDEWAPFTLYAIKGYLNQKYMLLSGQPVLNSRRPQKCPWLSPHWVCCGAALTWHHDDEELCLCFQEAVEILDSCWDIFHIIQHLGRAEMLMRHGGILENIITCTTEQPWQESSGVPRSIHRVPACSPHPQHRVCVHSLTWDTKVCLP